MVSRAGRGARAKALGLAETSTCLRNRGEKSTEPYAFGKLAGSGPQAQTLLGPGGKMRRGGVTELGQSLPWKAGGHCSATARCCPPGVFQVFALRESTDLCEISRPADAGV